MNRPYPFCFPGQRPIPCPESVRFLVMGENTVFIGMWGEAYHPGVEISDHPFQRICPALFLPGYPRKTIVSGS